MLFRNILGGAILFAGLLSQTAQATPAGDAETALVALMQTRVIGLDRDLLVFRYEVKSKFEPTTLQEFQKRLPGYGERFFNKAVVTSDMAGPGTYAATDPRATRDYGGTDPQLSVLTLRKGSQILALSNDLSTQERSYVNIIFKELNCGTGLPGAVAETDQNLFTLRRSSVEACRASSIRIVQAVKADAIEYSYSASQLKGCRNDSVAFNIISSKSIDFDKSAFFSTLHSFGPSVIADVTKSLYLEALQDFQLKLQITMPVPPTNYFLPASLSTARQMTASELMLLKRQEILGCGAYSSLENSGESLILGDIDQNQSANLQDSQIEAGYLALAAAYVHNPTVTNASSSDVFQIYAVQKATYLATGLPDDDALFLKWHSLQNDNAGEATIYQMYGEKLAPTDLEDNLQKVSPSFAGLSAAQKMQLDFVPRVLKASGVSSPGLSIYILNGMNLQSGNDLFLSTNYHQSLSDNLKQSRGPYLKILQACTAVYANANVTPTELATSPCRVLR